MVMLHGPPHQVVSYALLAVHHQSLLQGSCCVYVCVAVSVSVRVLGCVCTNTHGGLPVLASMPGIRGVLLWTVAAWTPMQPASQGLLTCNSQWRRLACQPS